MLSVIGDPAALRRWSDDHRASGARLALVPTMGALHRGHLELIESATRNADLVIVSIFVNPLQFGEHNDFELYPRPIDDDLDACRSARADVVYAPPAAAMYPDGFATTVSVAGLTTTMEGVARPGHFDGVTTVVAKLFTAARPHVALFGEKDFQQLAIVRRMTSDLDLGVEIIGHPTVREPDGLALSSRNRRLTESERRAARCIPRALHAAGRLAASGELDVAAIVASAEAIIAAEPLATADYVTVFDADTLRPVHRLGHDTAPGHVRIAAAVRIGDVRLIDNVDLHGHPFIDAP